MKRRQPGVPEIPGIDTNRVITTLGNDGEFFLELLEMFLTRFGDTAEQVRTDLARGNQEAAARQLHTLRGTAGSLGALKLVKSAQLLEEAILYGSSDTTLLLGQVAGQLNELKKAGTLLIQERKSTIPIP
jgi:HPt (histidine-containing phosphotransfer) domain-containing protein